MNTEFLGMLFVLLASLIGACGAIFLKKGSEKISITSKHLLIGIVLYIISAVFYIIGLKKGRLSVLYPFSSTTYLWACLFSTKFLGEKMNKYKWLGILTIIIGVSIIGFES